MSEPSLDWSTATVHKAKLTVGLRGEVSSGWRESFDTVAKLLDRGGWENVRLKKHEVRVTGVTAGSEDKLRHFLESIVQQSNANHRPEGESAPSSDSDGERQPERAGGAEEVLDAEMTERFRAFDQPPGATE